MLLQALMKLDGAGFTGPLQNMQGTVSGMIGKLAGLAGGVLAVGGAFTGIKDAMGLGGQLFELSQRTGVAVDQLMILRQAFDDTGVGADAGTQAIVLMQKALSGMSESGEPTNKMFAQLGLNMADLKNMSAEDQLTAIGNAIMNLADPAEQTAAAMAIFGRAGASLKQFFSDPEAINSVKKSLGDLPAIMAKNAKLFDDIGDTFTRLKMKGTGLFAGIAEGIAPALKGLADALDGIDLSGFGRKIGDALGLAVEFFRSGHVADIIGTSLAMAFTGALNFLLGPLLSADLWKGMANMVLAAFEGIGAALMNIIMEPILYMQAAMDKIADTIVNPTSTKTFKDFLDENRNNPNNIFRPDAASAAQDARERGALGLQQAQKALAEGGPFNEIMAVFRTNLDAWATEIMAAKDARQTDAQKQGVQTKGAGKLTAGVEGAGDFKFSGDALAKMGLFVGGSLPGLDAQKRTAQNTERIANIQERQLEELKHLNPQMGWAS